MHLRGIILFAHGSRDPLWHRPIAAVAQQIALKAPDVLVRCAYLELCPPSIEVVCAELVEAGMTQLTVVPMFLGMGKHAREDLPQLLNTLQRQYPSLEITCQAAMGEHPELIEHMATIALKHKNNTP